MMKVMVKVMMKVIMNVMMNVMMKVMIRVAVASHSSLQAAWTSYCRAWVDSTVMLVDFDHVSDKVFFQDTHVVTIITTEHWLFFSDNILPADVQQGGGREA